MQGAVDPIVEELIPITRPRRFKMKRPDDWTIIKLIQWTTTYFKEHGIESPRIDAELLLAFALAWHGSISTCGMTSP